MSPELQELLRKCIVLGGPLAEEACAVIRKDYPLHAANFLYPYDMKKDQHWQKSYCLNTPE